MLLCANMHSLKSDILLLYYDANNWYLLDLSRFEMVYDIYQMSCLVFFFFSSLGEFCNILLHFWLPCCATILLKKYTLMQLSILKSSLHSAWYMHYCGIDSKLFLFAWSSLFDQKWFEFGLYMLESKYYTGIFTIQMVFLNELTLMGQWDSVP